MKILSIITFTFVSLLALIIDKPIAGFSFIKPADRGSEVTVSRITPNPVDGRFYGMLILIPKSEELRSLSPILGNDFNGFKEAIGFRESSNDYSRVNSYGYLGKYQFGKHALQDIGIHNKKQFLESAEIQERAFIALCSLNKYKLRNYIEKYDGTYMRGVKLTESGMLAASHLLGPGAVINYIKSNGKTIGTDALGTSLIEYLTVFQGYDTSDISSSRVFKVTVS